MSGDWTLRTTLPSWALNVGADPNVVAARASGLRWSPKALAVLDHFDDVPARFVVAEHSSPKPSEFSSIREYIDFLREQHRLARLR